MKVVFDCRYIRLERHDGISRYTAGLVEAFSKLHPVTMLISDERQLAMLPDLPWIKGRPGDSLLEPWLPMLTLNRAKPDFVFSPLQTMGSTGKRGYAMALTFWDFVYYRMRTPPREFSWLIRAIWYLFHLSYWPQRWTLNRADVVNAGSETTAAEMRRVHLTRRPLEVIRPGITDSGLPARDYPAGKSLLYMGTFIPNKNVETLAKAMHLLPGYTLTLLSRVTDSARERLSLLAPDGSLVFVNGVSDERYRQLLSEATAMVSACRDEGFGIPLIEGLNSGTPLVVSDIPVYREVGGDAAVYFDQEDPAAFAAAVLGMDSEPVWLQLSVRARAQAARFGWDVSAKRLLELAKRFAPSR
ncbi:MAG: mannosyltransferase [Microbacteriaceae bacterium]|nr:mannosyltransferase [Microbacteriaceae bacterium]